MFILSPLSQNPDVVTCRSLNYSECRDSYLAGQQAAKARHRKRQHTPL
jgi:hypothetical protein